MQIVVLVAGCQFARTDELAYSYRWPITYSPITLHNCLKSNRHLTASCRSPIHKTFQIGIWLPFVCCLFSRYALNPSQIELASDCQLSVANSPGLTNLQSAVFWRLPIHLLFSKTVTTWIGICGNSTAFKSQGFAIWHMAAVCLLSIQMLCS